MTAAARGPVCPVCWAPIKISDPCSDPLTSAASMDVSLATEALPASRRISSARRQYSGISVRASKSAISDLRSFQRGAPFLAALASLSSSSSATLVSFSRYCYCSCSLVVETCSVVALLY